GQNNLLGGATFQVCRTQDRFGNALSPAQCVTVLDNTSPDANPTAGLFQLNNLALGRYTIRETVPPAGYIGDSFVETIDLTLAGPNGTAGHTWINVAGGQIAPTNTTCQQFASGTAGTLTAITYSVRNGVISQAAPGVFFYFSRLTAPSASFTIDLTQTKDSLGNHASVSFFGIQNG